MKRMTVWAGPVLSSKSTKALAYAKRLARRGIKVLLVRPADSVRAHETAGVLKTRAGDEWPANEIERASFLEAFVRDSRPDVLWIDEPMLFDDEPWVYDAVMRIRRTRTVLISGCAATSELEPFRSSLPRLIAVADYPKFCLADCDACGSIATATRSVCLTGKDGQVLVGGEETYRPVCHACWTKLVNDVSSVRFHTAGASRS